MKKRSSWLSRLVCAFMTLLLAISPIANRASQLEATTVNMNDLLLVKWQQWDALLTRWMDTNGSIVDLYDYSRRSRGHPSTISLSSFGAYLLSLANMYEQTNDSYYLAKLRYVYDTMIESSWFYRDVTGIGTIFYAPTWWFDDAEREPEVINTAFTGVVAVKLWNWTGQTLYRQLADRIASETLKLAAVNNATDMAWSYSYYSGRDEAHAKEGVNRQGAITMFYSIYAKEINSTYYDFIPKTLNWQFKAQLANGGFAYSIGDTIENRPYTGFHTFELLQGYLISSTGYADYVAKIQNALMRMELTKASFAYFEEYWVLSALISAWKSGAFTVNTTLVKAYTYISLNILNHTLYGEFSHTADNAHGWRFSVYGLGSFFASYPLPDGAFDVSDLPAVIDFTDLDAYHKNLIYNWDTSQGIDRLRYNSSNGIGLLHYGGLVKTLHFLFGREQGTPVSRITKSNYCIETFHDFTGNNDVKQYVYPFFTVFEVVGSKYFDIFQQGQNVMQATLSNGTTITVNNLFNSTKTLTESFVIYYSTENVSRFFVWSANTTWSFYNQTGYSMLRTTITNGKVLVAKLFKSVEAIKTHDSLYKLVPYKDLSQPLTSEQVLKAYSDVKNRFGELVFGTINWEQVYSQATNGTVRLLMHNKPQIINITAWLFQTEKLTFTVNGPSEASSITKIYVGDKGRPTKLLINNVERPEDDGWSYDNITRILTVTITHSNSNLAEIVIDWRILGDVNGDDVVDRIDLDRVAKAYGASLGEAMWDIDTDLNRDNIVNILDLNIVCRNYGKKRTF